MRILQWRKDGGEYSRVTGFFLIESKSLFSIVLLHFARGSREAFHSHAFNCFSWVLSGGLLEEHMDGREDVVYRKRIRPFPTRRDTFHRVFGLSKSTWVLSIRGPWANRWTEYLPLEQRFVTLTHGRAVVDE